jgi:hypothetical protein
MHRLGRGEVGMSERSERIMGMSERSEPIGAMRGIA